MVRRMHEVSFLVLLYFTCCHSSLLLFSRVALAQLVQSRLPTAPMACMRSFPWEVAEIKQL